MNAWSLSKIFTKVTAQEFKKAAENLKTSMEEACGEEMLLSYELYSEPWIVTVAQQDGINSKIANDNVRKIFARITDPKELTDELWEKARYARACVTRLESATQAGPVSATVEAKGLRPKQMTFYVDPEELSGLAETSSKLQFRSWLKGSGYEANHIFIPVFSQRI